MNLILSTYTKIKLFMISLRNLTKLIKFTYFIHVNHLFRDGEPKLILLLVKRFVELESSNYKQVQCFGRSVQASTNLLSSLIESYLNTNSEVTLEQVMTVLGEEFIKREQNNGRKQF